ncbi:hypothetical protein Tco_0037652 [Tanacetum coccineum]
MEQVTSKGKAVLIEEIVDHDVNDVVRKELDADSGNSGKIPLVTFHQTNHVRKYVTIVATNFRDEQDVLNDVNFNDVVFDDVSFDDVDFDDVSFDDIEFDVIDFNVGIDDLNFEQELEEVLYYATDYSASISGKSGDVPTWFSDEDVDQGIDVEWKDDSYHSVDELGKQR